MTRDRLAISTRSMLRTFQALRRDGLDAGMSADIELLRHRDMDLSIKHGGLLAFNALLLTVGVNPLTASPGAPLSLDAALQAGPVLLTSVGCLLLVASAYLCVRALMFGEDFDVDDRGDDPHAIALRLYAAFCTSLDAQSRLLRAATWLTIAGGAVVALAFGWILAGKMAG